MSDKDESVELKVQRALIRSLESLQAAGVTQLRLTSRGGTTADSESIVDSGTASELSKPVSPPSARSLFETGISDQPSLSLDDRRQQLKVLQQEVADCTRCAELVDNRSQTVFGVGNPQARLVFFGEAPGADEDREGEPFVGRAGRLLTDIITKGMGMRRDDVYIMNVVKCRPPGNRNPKPDETDNCRGYFERQFEIIQPEFICCLGAVAATTLLETNQSIGRLRGRLHDYRGIQVLATYHPAYLLRNPSAKREVWKDIQVLMRQMGLPVPEKD